MKAEFHPPEEGDPTRIGIFLANYFLTMATRALVLELRDCGFAVDLFLCRAKLMVDGHPLLPGEVFVIETPGGGGYGTPVN